MKRLLFILGPTAAGKTVQAIEWAKRFDTEIVSCDSRQFYQEMDIGVARPSKAELAEVKHHFIACRSIEDPYNVYSYEQDAIKCIERLFEQHDTVIAVGGSGLYIEAICNGIAWLPDPKPGLRESLKAQFEREGIESFQRQLQQLDPSYYRQVDQQNPIRLQRALEVCLTSGRPYSELIAEQKRQKRPFQIERIVVNHEPEVLRDRINQRVELMLESGLEEEVRRLLPYRHLTPLNTVGYKEFFNAWDLGNNDTRAIAEAIKTHTWQYAKKQLTWLKSRV